MLFKNITIIDENFDVRENMNVLVVSDRISYVGKEMPKCEVGEVYDGKNKLLLPGFYNGHTHLPMTIMRGYAENLSLDEWLHTKIFPFEAKLTYEDMYYSGLLGVCELLRFGTCAVEEMYINQVVVGNILFDSGIKGNFCASTISFDEESYKDTDFYKKLVESFEKYHYSDNGRIKAEFCIHAEYSNNERVMKDIARMAKEYNSSMHIHIAETIGEVEACKKKHNGKTPVEYFNDIGAFDVPTVAAHCVYLTDNDIEILKEKNVTVATCPKSNAKLASGIAPIAKLLKAGVNVIIGTDSVVSNNSLDMIDEMRFFNLLQKATTLDPTVVTPKETLYAATRAGAIAQRRFDCGLIKEGFKADITVMDIDNVSMKPVHNLLNNLIYSSEGTDVVLTMVDGKVLYKDGEYKFLDVEKLVYEVEKRKERIIGAK